LDAHAYRLLELHVCRYITECIAGLDACIHLIVSSERLQEAVLATLPSVFDILMSTADGPLLEAVLALLERLTRTQSKCIV